MTLTLMQVVLSKLSQGLIKPQIILSLAAIQKAIT